jgi:hypothetical protein
MCHEVKIFLSFDFVNGSLSFLPSSFIRFWANFTSCSTLEVSIGQKPTWMDRITSWLRYHGLEISGTSGRIKKPLMATGKEITPSMIKSLIGKLMLERNPQT